MVKIYTFVCLFVFFFFFFGARVSWTCRERAIARSAILLFVTSLTVAAVAAVAAIAAIAACRLPLALALAVAATIRRSSAVIDFTSIFTQYMCVMYRALRDQLLLLLPLPPQRYSI